MNSGSEKTGEEQIPRQYSNHELRNLFQNLSHQIEHLSSLQLLMKNLLTKIDEDKIIGKEVFDLLKEKDHALKTMDFCAKQGKYLLDNELLFTRLESKSLEINPIPFNPQEVIDQVTELFSIAVKQKRINISSRVNRPSPTLLVKGDPFLLTQILSNLLNNAIKFTREQGSIEITLQEEFKNGSDGSSLWFTVKDTGIGMTEREQARLFKQFSQASPQTVREFGGSGLGLKITQLLVKLLGGSINVISQKDKGTTFKFNIVCQPYVVNRQDMDLDQKIVSSAESPLCLKNIRILIVEDNSINREMLKAQLKKVDGICLTADSGENAISILSREEVDIILMDVLMPGMDGITATQKIRALQKSLIRPVPVIGISGCNDQTVQDQALQAGMSAYFIKPYKKELLFKTIFELAKINPQKSLLSSLAVPPFSTVKTSSRPSPGLFQSGLFKSLSSDSYDGFLGNSRTPVFATSAFSAPPPYNKRKSFLRNGYRMMPGKFDVPTASSSLYGNCNFY